jgi:hypothetical protein
LSSQWAVPLHCDFDNDDFFTPGFSAYPFDDASVRLLPVPHVLQAALPTACLVSLLCWP